MLKNSVGKHKTLMASNKTYTIHNKFFKDNWCLMLSISLLCCLVKLNEHVLVELLELYIRRIHIKDCTEVLTSF